MRGRYAAPLDAAASPRLLAVALCLPASGGRRHALPDRRPRLGPRRRDEPVRRPRLRARRAGATSGSSRTTTAAPSCASCRRGGFASCSPSGAPAVKIGSTKPFRVVDARGKVRKLKPGVQRLVGGKLAKLRFPLRYEPGAAPLTLDGDAYRGALIVHRDARHADGRQQAPARPLPARRRAVGDAGRLAPGGAARAGGRRALVRAGDAEAGHALRPLRRHPQPGLRRRRGRGGDDEPRDRLDRRSRPPLERAGRDDLLPLDLGREDRCGRRGLAATRRPVPYLVSVAGPVRRPLEASPLGAGPADAGRGREDARARARPRPASSRAGRRAGSPR